MENYQKGMNESFIRQQNPYINQNMPPRGLNGPDMRYRQYSQPPNMAQNKRPQDSLYLSRGRDVHPSDNRYNIPHQQIPHHSNTMSAFQPQSQPHSQSQPMNQQMNQPMNQSNSSSMLSNIAPPSGNFNMGNHYLRPQTVSELVLVPVELASFAAEPKFQQILLRVKEESKINYISLNRMSDNFVESIAIDAQNKESAQLARYLIETHLKLQMKVKLAETRLQKIQTDLFSTQGEIAAGQMIEFAVKPQLIGLAIGKKGSRIKQIEVETGVSSINVTDNGQIMIYGPDSQSVQKARELLEIFEDSFELHPHQAEWLLEKGNSQILGDLKSGANLMLVKVNKENSTLEVVGTGTSVQMARCLLSTQMEYVDRQMEIERNEKEARDKLHAVRKQYGLSNQWKGKKGNNPYNNEAETLPTDLKITINNHNAPNAPTQSKPQAQLDSLYAFAQRNSGNENANKFDKNQKEEKQKKSDDSGVMDTKNLEKSMVDAALDALISKDYPDEEPRSQQRRKNNKPMDSLMPNSNNKNEPKEKVKKESEVNNSKNQGKSNRGSKEEVNFNKSSPILTSNQHDTKSKNSNTQKSDKNDRNDRNDKTSNKGKNTEREKSAIEKKIDSLLPPPPTLTVPPVPPQDNDDKKNDPKNSRRKNKKGSKGDGDQEPSQISNRQNNLKNGKDEKKEPMLIKINNPFAEKIKLEVAEDNGYDEFIPQATKSSGPPKEPPSSIALVSSNAAVSKPPGLERVVEQKQDNQGENKKNSKNRKNEKSATKKTSEIENIESMIEDLQLESKQSNETSVSPSQVKTEENDNSSKNKEGKKKSKNKETKKLNSSEEDSLPTKEASPEDEN